MSDQNVLFSFVGNRDPYPPRDEEPGPLLSLLQEKNFSRVYLFCTGPDYLERARMVEEAAGVLRPGCRFLFVNIDLDSPIDYSEIFLKVKQTCLRLLEELARRRVELFILLDPGTPQMQTVWFLLARCGLLPARLLQGIPPRFAGGAYKVREVDLESGGLPEVSLAAEAPVEPTAPSRNKEQAPRWYSLTRGQRIVGEDPGFLMILEQARKAATYDIAVLIRGETGTGKGLAARLIHEQSGRAGQPFVAVNCASIGPALSESELFGHIKGAFTGADRDRLGKFRSAEGGILFLDEVGDLPPEIQPKLLRVLEEKTLVPVGSDKEVKVDVRILAATNQNLEELIDAGRFRRDLYERLAQLSLHLPPLRERRTDIPILIRHFLAQWNAAYPEGKRAGEPLMQLLLDYPWPGNVRELDNAVKALCASSISKELSPELLPAAILSYFNRRRQIPDLPVTLPAGGVNLKALLFQIEKEFYQQALERAGGNREKAAGLLGLNAPAFRKAMRERFGEGE